MKLVVTYKGVMIKGKPYKDGDIVEVDENTAMVLIGIKRARVYFPPPEEPKSEAEPAPTPEPEPIDEAEEEPAEEMEKPNKKKRKR